MNKEKPLIKLCPVTEGSEYEIIIEGIGKNGDGIGKYQGFVIIVPGGRLGDHVRVRIKAVRSKVSFAEMIERFSAENESDE